MKAHPLRIGVIAACIVIVVISVCEDFLKKHPDLTPEEAEKKMAENWGPGSQELQRGDLIVIIGSTGHEETYLILSIYPDSLRVQRIFATHPLTLTHRKFRESGLKITRMIRQDQHDEYKELLLETVARRAQLE